MCAVRCGVDYKSSPSFPSTTDTKTNPRRSFLQNPDEDEEDICVFVSLYLCFIASLYLCLIAWSYFLLEHNWHKDKEELTAKSRWRRWGYLCIIAILFLCTYYFLAFKCLTHFYRYHTVMLKLSLLFWSILYHNLGVKRYFLTLY